MTVYFQQGDLLLKMVEALPSGASEVKTDLVHKGENHHHRVRGDFSMFSFENDIFIYCKDAELFHEEHHTIKIPEGLYQKGIVQEYDHFLEESRAVID